MTPTRSCSTARAFTSMVRSPTRSSSCSTPSTTARRTRSACSTPSRAFEMSPKFNVWMGRFLPPSDRANLYGPVLRPPLERLHRRSSERPPVHLPGPRQRRGVLGRFQQSEGVGGRVRRPVGHRQARGHRRRRACRSISGTRRTGYYLNGTYYGGKNLLGVGAAIQAQDGNTATTVDFLLEKKLPDGGVLTVESEYANYDQLGGYDGRYRLERRRVHPRRVPVSQNRRHRQVRDSRQVRQGGIQQGRRAGRLRPGHDRVQLQLRHQGVQRARDVLLHEHRFHRGEDPIPWRPASASKSRCSTGVVHNKE